VSARNARKREKLHTPEWPAIVPAEAHDFQAIDEWVPNYGRECEICGRSPCVTGIYRGRVAYDGTMCGVCTWGEAACLDPANW
jgi:hypothetical protein